MNKKNLFHHANTLWRERNYKEAEKIYELLLLGPENNFKKNIIFNLGLVRKRLSNMISLNIEIINESVQYSISEKKIRSNNEDLEDLLEMLVRYFDERYYLLKYPDIKLSKINPLDHYINQGWREFREPNSWFSSVKYLNSHPHLRSLKSNPFLHYLRFFRSYETSLDSDYVDRILDRSPAPIKRARLLAFYLPQFHEIPENDRWWGKGFTEWTNVIPAKPQFKGHYQPHVPNDFLGYYNLLEKDTFQKQVELAKQYGIEGFCFYLYWFSGHKLLERPLDNYLSDKTLNFPFCICWANENWSRRWDGLDNEVLISQKYSPDDDIAFIENASKYLKDPRYIKVDGRPVLLVYRPELLDNITSTVIRWRNWCRENGIGEIYLIYPQSFEVIDPAVYGFDAACEFPPINSNLPDITGTIKTKLPTSASTIYDWLPLLHRSKNYSKPSYKLFRGVNPSWDNTPRKKNNSSIVINSSPRRYLEWLKNAIEDTHLNFPNPNEQLIFINAWNEWAEGAHLEPDKHFGYAYLDATRMAQTLTKDPRIKRKNQIAIVIHAFYIDVFKEIIFYINNLIGIEYCLYVTTPHEEVQEVSQFLKRGNYPFKVLGIDNRGRDVLPFLKIMQEVVEDGFECILKVHTKKSLHRNDGEVWRKDIYSQLLNLENIKKALNHFSVKSDVGIIGPIGHIVPICYYFGSNHKKILGLGIRLGIPLDEIISSRFVAGSMFFARIDSLLPILNLGLSEVDFESEEGQIDGTMAHALERFFSIVAATKSYKTVDIELRGAEGESASYSYAGG